MSINYFLNTKYINSNFAVPNVIVDDYIRSADGDYIKILLIVLRNTSVVPTIEQLVLISGLSIDTVKSALKFWSDNGIICAVDNFSKISDIKNYKPKLLQPSVIMQLAEDSKDIKDIINIMVFDNTISRWASMGVSTLEDANKYLHNEDYFRNVAKIFNLKYLLPNQKELVAFWSENNYPLEIVQHVYDVLHNFDMSNNGGQSKANIFYINKLISNWISKGINTLDRIKQLERTSNLYDLWSAGNNSNNNRNKRGETTISSYNIEDLINPIEWHE